MTGISPQERDRDRRETVERYHALKDAGDDFAVAKAAAASAEERRQLMNEFADFRRRHREQDVERGKRSPGLGVLMHQIMWARWVEIAAEHEAAARSAYEEICAGDTAELSEELRHSLVAITAAASTVEAPYEDVKYLIPPRKWIRAASARFADGITGAFGLPPDSADSLRGDLKWLFDRRNEAVHPYAEPEAPRPHPSGLNTSAEASRFNAAESRTALHVALRVLEYAAAPPCPANRWVQRWVEERRSYHENAVAPIPARLQ